MAELLDIRLNEPEQSERSAPIDLLDRAFTLLRRAGLRQSLRGISASVPLAAALICLYAMERVLGVQPPLPLFAALCSLAYWARYHVLSGLARRLVSLLGLLPEGQPQLVSGLKTAMVAGIGSCGWAACLIALGQRSFFGLLACLPLLCVRGAIAPSLLARSACAPDAGLAALTRSIADTRELRHVFVRVELLALIALLLVFGNLYALLASLLFVASSVLGLDVGFVNALIAPDNELVLLLLLGLATLLLEPLRAAVSALALQSARERSAAADLHAAIAALSAVPRPRSRPQPRAAFLGLLMLGSLITAHVHADDLSRALPQPARDASATENRAGQQPHGPVPAESALGGKGRGPRALPAALVRDASVIDGVARAKAQAILARGEFLPSVADSERGALQAWLERRLRERERELSEHDLSTPPRFELRVPPIVVVSASLLLMLAVGVWLVRGLRRARSEASAARLRASRAPTQADCLAEAARFAQEASYAAAVRSLYAACVLALARGKPAGASSTQTNGQLLMQLAPGQLRAAFDSLTSSFERCCYGRQKLSRADYERAHTLAQQVLQLAPHPRAASDSVEVPP